MPTLPFEAADAKSHSRIALKAGTSPIGSRWVPAVSAARRLNTRTISRPPEIIVAALSESEARKGNRLKRGLTGLARTSEINKQESLACRRDAEVLRTQVIASQLFNAYFCAVRPVNSTLVVSEEASPRAVSLEAGSRDGERTG